MGNNSHPVLRPIIVWPNAQAQCNQTTTTATATTTTTTTVLWPPGLGPGLPGWAGTRKVKPIWIYWSKRQWVAVASAGPYADLHLAPDR